jgi:hypothetical protein
MNQDNLAQSFAAAVGGRDKLASNYSARTFRDLNQRADRQISEAVELALEGCAAIDKAAARLKLEDPAFLEELKAEHVGRVRGAWAAYEAAGSRVLNWMITGPARFPVERNRKRMQSEHNRLTEYLAIAKGAGAWAEKRIKRRIRDQLGPVGVVDQELDQARAELARRERNQECMRATNKAIRKHKAKPNAAELVAEELADTYPEISVPVAAKLLQPDFCGRIGFADYQLSNNNAEIRRRRARVDELERKAAAVLHAAAAELEEPELEAPDGIRIVENQLEQRVQILFPDKPSAEIRGKLKGRGFRWAPSAGAWQRQLTPQAVDVARAIVASINQENQ